jgi:diguanylate cyclase (GGDEF)-like protein
MVLDGCDDAGALEMAESIRTQVEETSFLLQGRKVEVTLSAGIATIEAGVDLDTAAVLRAADEALYESKAKGRNRTTVHKSAG